jgi:protein archease
MRHSWKTIPAVKILLLCRYNIVILLSKLTKITGAFMSTARWEHFEHEADMGVRGIGHTLASAFEQAALAMSAIITDLSLIEPREEISIICEEADQELLFADWLNALIFEMSTRNMLFSQFEVFIENGRLIAKAWGEPINVKRHQPAVEIKGATYTELAVRRSQDQWVAQCVVDV